MISLRRVNQFLCLLLFLLLIVFTAFPVPDWLPVTRVFALDPLLFLGPLLTGGTLITGLSVLLALFAATAVLGRFFCAHVCPFGTTLDYSRPLVAKSKQSGPQSQPQAWAGLRNLKYLLLLLGISAALLGLNLLHWGSPLSLAARFYILILEPFLNVLLHWIESPFRSLFSNTGLPAFAPAPHTGFSTLSFLAVFLGGLFAVNRWIPRFWCRFLCPAGAVLALIGHWSLIKRRVSEACTECGRCRRSCPMQAIPEDPKQTLSTECILCQKCRQICPEEAIIFSFFGNRRRESPQLPGRRAALQAIGLGFLFAFLGKADQAESRAAGPIRPPGALSEELFLSRCIRCGMCLEVCPTNMLQPEPLTQGLAAQFAPLAVPRIGPCEPGCNGCTQVCPSGAIRILDLEEKMWAKMGTAFIERRKCLAWTYDRSCLVCDEVCPYGAVELHPEEGKQVHVPFVTSRKCTGCGFCEHACPVQGQAAILVRNMFEQRLSHGSYIEAGQRLGLSISRQDSATPSESAGSSGKEQDLPPGFSE